METKDRIALLDDLMLLNEQVGLSEADVAGLVDFVAALQEAEREAILEYIRQGDRFNRLERFTKLANMDAGKRTRILTAMGIQLAPSKSSLKEFLGITGESVSQVKQRVNDLAAVRKTLQEDLFEPIAGLFGLPKKGRR